jgi:hypothetical protein
MNSWNFALSGAILIGYWAIGLFFFRFRRRTGDHFFTWFGWAFWLLAAERVLLLALGTDEETRVYVYMIRLVAFLFILYAIYQKNSGGNTNDLQSRKSQEPS